MTWEQRWHPLREEWIIVAAHRQNRPWSGETFPPEESVILDYVPDCYLCPGNLRVSGKRNDTYTTTFVFDNDHPCVGMDAPPIPEPPGEIYRNRRATGIARVVCYSPRHSLTLAELEVCEINQLLQVWQEQYRDLGSREEINHVLVFENKGEVVGVSNPHPHCQIYGTNFVYKTIEIEARVSQAHLGATGRVLFQDILRAEREAGRRIIVESDASTAFLPYFARYAYEVYVAPKRTVPSISALNEAELRDFAGVLKKLLVKMDNLWRMPLPYVMTLHQAPTGGGDYPGFHYHIEIHPPLRRPNLLKYLAGPEIGGGNFLSDTSPEEKAQE
ncbi:MAG TPA: galactose-1-phosphate uridylyltransferase, partial [Blastocatellia bacterium]|nr:galactose-1-phosphate uridylyltransferase [Blastocatellia bacterium]